MKKIVFCALLLSANLAFGQQTDDPKPVTREDYIQKSRSQKVAAFIFLGLGVTAFVVVAQGDVSLDIVPVLVIGGGLAILGSIPLFIASAKNKRKAASLSFSNMMTPQIKNSSMVYRAIPAVSLKVSL